MIRIAVFSALVLLAVSPFVRAIQRPPAPPTPAPRVDASVDRMHADFLDEFVLMQGFGRLRVTLAASIERSTVKVGGESRVVARRRLIGDWREGGPRLYEPDDHLLMKRVAKAKWEPLDAADRAALEKLRAGAERVVGDERILGAVRARKSCLECHEVEPGTLLGAFRYDLERPAPGGEIHLVPQGYQPPEAR
jgi:hypothetical protein